ncbi:phosphotransferase [Novosphingobium taihuense]|uniref:Aminoglycoside phosphotransferase (APT) family kinase protein n=1 Tax=Novosphingobium taihuense TaxID=260085 RepID=A0A7W7ACW9_9SPHN|nr:phosphotransferase [Novosphingobium taihuense]MBB4614725.1 aminoglycoside phosphotransferase (APT) family kinase protein [Novosphingobium taihuense]TWH86033.1 aminoglycoside phosphotransferase (APT) family kinase protein [Novosphingobium taihuense]
MEGLLEAVMARAGVVGRVTGLQRLSGGANMESWVFGCAEERFVLRRAPSAEWIAARPLDMAGEAELMRRAHAAGVHAPEVVAELAPNDALGIGFIMRCLPGTADPEVALSSPPNLADDLARAMAGIHALNPSGLEFLPRLFPGDGVEGLAQQFADAGGDRPVIALGLAWLRANLPPPAPLVVVHGDFRIGNLMVENGRLSGVLDWELAHLGDGHEDLAYGCMTVWRFGRLDRQGFGLTDVASLARAYEAAGGEPFDAPRFRFWLVYRTVWWALGCLAMGRSWREGTDRSLERVVVARRCAEQELDLLLLLESEAPESERRKALSLATPTRQAGPGEPSAAEILTAISEWLAATVKPNLAGRERWELAVAQNALGIVRRELAGRADPADKPLADDLLAGRKSLATPGLLATLRARVLSTLAADMPKYPALAAAAKLWEQH